MKLTKIRATEWGTYPEMSKPIEDIDNVLVLVPDEESYHEVNGLMFLFNKKWEIHILEPGTSMSWQGMFSPWHLNTDSYRLIFNDHTPIYVERE